MKLFYYIAPTGNFGDDINEWVWHELLPKCWDEHDETTFVGIGSVFDGRIPDTKTKVIFGTGLAYAQMPKFTSGRWDIYCVRGPITAKILGLEEAKSVTDSAILIASIYDVIPKEERKGVAFMPHISAARDGNWELVCKKAGIEYLDPQLDSKVLIKRISGVKLLIADAMHGAIIADTMRVPWVPVVTSGEINTLKWLDWTASMSVEYRPVLLPQSCFFEWLRNIYRLVRGQGDQVFSEIEEHNQIIIPQNAAEIAIENYKKTFGAGDSNNLNDMPHQNNAILRYIKNLFCSKFVKFLTCPLDKYHFNRATKILENTSKLDPYLSDDKIFNDKLKKMLDLLRGIRKKYSQ